ncbi:thermonuclease family protein [Ancylobacter dichloromethanicus]
MRGRSARPRGWRPQTLRGILVAVGLIVVALVVERVIPRSPARCGWRMATAWKWRASGCGSTASTRRNSTRACGEGAKEWPCGAEARAALEALVARGAVSCRPVDEDRYGRAVSVCSVDGADIGAALVRQGWAVALGLAYRAEERAAQAAGAGIWSGRFERPAEWRARHPRPAE